MSFGKLLAGVATLALIAPAAQASVTTFSLPPSPTQTPDVVGPVDEESPTPRSTPTPQQPTPTPSPRPAPIRQPPTSGPVIQAIPTPTPTISPSPAQTAQPAPSRQRPSPSTTAPAQPATVVQDSPALPSSDETRAAALPEFTPPPPQADAAPTQEVAETTGTGLPWWAWLIGAALLLGGVAAFFLGRRSASSQAIPEIRRPQVAPKVAKPEPEALAPIPKPADQAATAPQPVPAPAPAPATSPAPAPHTALEEQALIVSGNLIVRIDTRQLSISLMNATLAYTITLANNGSEAIGNIAINGDLVSAHASLPRDEQFSHAKANLPELQWITSLSPGETRELRGTIIQPLDELRPIQKGSTVLFVPLLRLRLSQGQDVVHRTLLLGLPPAQLGGALLPIRLDQGLRTHAPLLQRSFA